MNPLENISVDLVTGAVAYPKTPGFVLDVAKLRRVAALFLEHGTKDVAMAYRLAIHDQLAAFRGLATVRPA